MPRAARTVLRLSAASTAWHAGSWRRSRRLSLSTVVGAIGIMLVGCTAPSAPGLPEGARGLPDGVTVEFVQLRSDVAARQAQVQVRNGGEDPLEISTVTVSDPRFEGVAERVIPGRASTVAPGSTVDIRIQLPPMNCDAADGAMTVVLGAREAALSDPLDVIGPLHERECLAQRVMDAAGLTFSSFEPSPPGEAAVLVLSVDPTGEGSAEVAGIQTTNLLTFEASATDTYPLGLEITPDSEPVEIALPLVPMRCDAHAVQEDKRGTVFTLEVALDDVPGEIELATPEDMRGRILTWIGDWCGFGG